MTDRLITADASAISPADFFRALTGRPPMTATERAEKERQAAEYWAEHRWQMRAELEELRDRLCKIASPELAAKFRAQWAVEDAEAEAREQRRAA